ncbi:hypothetical protein AY599_06475 [Leptolyngbya valderiana BDU 20041]|nr:hypothetical protein AY599_06475 [Leptolyngbya valderiana BDU 20041]
MSFILDALRKSDQRRRSSEGPDLTSAPVEVTSDLPSKRKRGGRLGLLLVVAVVVAATLAYVERDRLEQQWTAWTGQSDGPGAGVPDPVEPISPGERGAEPGVDPAVAAYRERVGTPRERLVSDPDTARAEIERLVAAQNASSGSGDGSAEPVDRRSPTPSRAGQSVSRAAPAREINTAPSPEEAERIERRLLEARQRAQQQLAGDSSSSSQGANDRQRGGTPGQSTGGGAAPGSNGAPGSGGRADPGGRRIVGADSAPGAVSEPATAMPRPQDRPIYGQEAPAVTLDESAGLADEPDWTPEAAEYIRAWELPLSVRRSLPALTLNIHVFSDLPEERFVLINGERYVSGDELVDGAQLVDIRREGAIVDYRDYRFLLEP